MKNAKYGLCFAVVVTAAAPSAVQAAGFEVLEQSGLAQGTSYAGAGARSDDPSTIYYNPASLARLPGVQIGGGLAGIFPQSTLLSGTSTTGKYLGGSSLGGTVGGNFASSAAAPHFYATAQLAGGIAVGLAITSPFGLATVDRPGAATRYYALTTELQTVNFGPTIAWHVLPTLSIGGGFNVEVAKAHLSNAVDFGTVGALNGLGPFGLLPGKADGAATVKGDDVAMGWNLGLLYEPMPTLRIGLAYRSAVFHQLNGTVTYYGVPAPLAGAFVSQAATAKLPEPATASLSGAWDIGDFTLLGSATYTGWSVVHSVNAFAGGGLISSVPQNYHDTVAVAAGADYRVNDRLTVRAGAMFDPTPVPSAYRSPRLPDANRYWLSLGATYRPMPNLAVTAAYSHIFAPNATVALTDSGPGTPNFTRGNLNAVYSLSFDIFSLDATLKF